MREDYRLFHIVIFVLERNTSINIVISYVYSCYMAFALGECSESELDTPRDAPLSIARA